MYKSGHVGAALLAYAPLAFVLLVGGRSELALAGGAAMVVLATVPDADHRLPVVAHRGGTHSLAFAVLVGVAVGVFGILVAPVVVEEPPAVLGALGFVVGVLAIGSHIAVDAITPMGIRPFWPFSRRHFTFDLVRSNSPIANVLFLVAGVLAAVVVYLLAAQIG